jgi:hypothetical protein
MPKISTNQIQLYHKDIKKNYDIVINYNQKVHFYTIIPDEFKEVVHHLDDELKDGYFITKLLKRKYDESTYSYVINASSESDCLERTKVCLRALTDKIIEKRNVIIVFYEPNDNMRYNNHLHNDEHPQIGLKFGLTYAVETSVGDKKVYSLYSKYEAFGKMNTDRKELNLWNKASTIIPDTPENRVMLEQLYSNLDKLNKKLTEFTSTPDKMLEFISSNIKMLTS